MTKIMMKDRISDYDLSDFFDEKWMTLATFKKELNEIHDQQGFRDTDLIYIAGDNSGVIARERLETDAEYATRLKREEYAKRKDDATKATKAEKELALYNKLKAKYEQT
jgi:predicted MPP superfamily phosphohydrolase